MKINKFILIALFMSVFFLAGCQQQETEKSAEEKAEVKVTTQPVEEPGAPSEADATAYEAALQLKDKSYCGKISEETNKEICRTDVDDQIVLDEALTEGDINVCNNLSNTDKQDSCKIKIEVIKKEEQLRLESQQEKEFLMNLSNEIVASGDVSRCKEMEEDMVAGCELNILVNDASAEDNPELCEKASSKETIQACKDSIKEILGTT